MQSYISYFEGYRNYINDGNQGFKLFWFKIEWTIMNTVKRAQHEYDQIVFIITS